MKLFFSLTLLVLFFTSCWPTSVSFVDKGSMPEEWQYFSVKTLENSAPNAPLSYPATLSEKIKDGVQNNTKLKLVNNSNASEVQIEGKILNYMISPIALQAGDLAAKNRLNVTVNFTIRSTKPKVEEMTLSVSRFADYESSQDFTNVEQNLLEEINKQIVQDVINKLLSNW